MTLDAIILGILQGITEFIPISSSGHLAIFQELLGLTGNNIALDVVMHVGTLAAILLYFNADIRAMLSIVGKILRAPLNQENWRTPHGSLIISIFMASLVTGVIGLTFQKSIESVFHSLPLIGGLLLLNGCILFLNRYTREWRNITYTPEQKKGALNQEDVAQITIKRALLVGLAQSFAILPGISRSGMTISSAVALGINREVAARFSFLISVPAILGSLLLKSKEIMAMPSEMVTALIIGGLVSFVIGYIALKILIRVVASGNLIIFAYYCWGAGTLVLLYSYL